MAKPVKKPVKNASTATLEEIAEAVSEAERRKRWQEEKKTSERNCDLCGKPFKASRMWQVFCSDFCRVSAFQNKARNNEMGLLQRLQELEEENAALKARIKELGGVTE